MAVDGLWSVVEVLSAGRRKGSVDQESGHERLVRLEEAFQECRETTRRTGANTAQTGHATE
jgi:hypothetical protein